VSAADGIAQLLRQRVPSWTEEEVEPGLVKFTDTDPDWTSEKYGARFVLVDGRERSVFVLPEQFAFERMGPALIGCLHGVVTHVCYAPILDSSEMRAGLDALESMNVLPAYDEGTA
jgi:hypothetical protein